MFPDCPVSTPSSENEDVIAFHFCHLVKSTLDLERVFLVPDLVNKREHTWGHASLDSCSYWSYIYVSSKAKTWLEILINAKLRSEVVPLSCIIVDQICLEVEWSDIDHAHVEKEFSPCSFQNFHIDWPCPKAIWSYARRDLVAPLHFLLVFHLRINVAVGLRSKR